MSFQTDQGNWCVLVVFLTKHKPPNFKVVPLAPTITCLRNILQYFKMLISHDDLKYFLSILQKQ